MKPLQQLFFRVFILSLLVSGSSFSYAEGVEMTDAEKATQLEQKQSDAELKRELLGAEETDLAPVENENESSKKGYTIPQRKAEMPTSKEKGNFSYSSPKRPSSDNFGKVRSSTKLGAVVGNTQRSSTRTNRDKDRNKFKNNHNRLNKVLNKQSKIQNRLNQ